jgi:hypothetical protein
MSSRSSDSLCVNTICFLVADMVQNIYSGLGSAPFICYCISPATT